MMKTCRGTRKGKSPLDFRISDKIHRLRGGLEMKKKKKEKKLEGEKRRRLHTRAPWFVKERAPRFSVCTRPSLFSAKKIYHVCRGCTRPRDKRGGVCRGKRDWKFCGPASFADDPVFYCVQVKLICSYFLYSTSRRKEQPPFCFLFFISLSIIFLKFPRDLFESFEIIIKNCALRYFRENLGCNLIIFFLSFFFSKIYNISWIQKKSFVSYELLQTITIIIRLLNYRLKV